MKTACLTVMMLGMVGTSHALAQAQAPAIRFDLSLAQPGATAATTDPSAPPAVDLAKQASIGVNPPVFGAADDRWWLTIAPAIGTTFSDETNVGLRTSLTTFVAENIQIGGEGSLWYFQQPGDNAFGGSLGFVLRWHFVNTNTWTVFLDSGIGVVAASEEIPSGGTQFNFMPRAGIGFTRKITDGGARFEMGLGWHHVSNARINGDDENPSIDLPMVHFGIVFPL
ncbi:MAG: acyloxyacyl hydrolase [Tepidisphaera sp.]